MKTEIEIGQIYKFNRRHFQGDVLLYDKIDNHTGARLFILCILKNIDKKLSQEIFSAIVSAFTEEYPRPSQSVTMEERLSAVNLSLYEILRQTGTAWLKNFSCVLVELDKNLCSATSAGNAFIYLTRNKKIIQLTTASGPIKPDSIFDDFTSGTIRAKDNLIITSRSLFNYISIDQLTKVLTKQTGQNAANTLLENVKSMVKIDEPIVGMIISVSNNSPQKTKQEGEIKNTAPGQTTNYTPLSKPPAPRKIRLDSVKKKINYKPIVLATLSLMILAMSVYFTISSLPKPETPVDYYTVRQQLVTQAEEKLNDAEIALIRRDDQTAGQLLEEAEQIINQIFALQGAGTAPETSLLELENRRKDLSKRISP